MAGVAREGDWQCPNPECVNHQQFPNSFVYASKVNCTKCGTGRTAKRAGDWCCPNTQCVNHTNTVYGSKAMCSRCGTPKPALGGRPVQMVVLAQPGLLPQQIALAPQMVQQVVAPTIRQGDWHCPNPSCKNHTGNNFVYGSKSACGVCGTPKPADVASSMPGVQALPQASQQMQLQQVPQLQQLQQLQQPFHLSQQFQASQQLQAAQFQGQPLQQPFQGMQYQVQPQMSQSQLLGMPKGRPGNGMLRQQPGDWHCPNAACKNFSGNVVYASKTHCPLCNTPKPALGARLSTKMHEGDWQCPTPGCKNNTNFVYASKPACTICGAPNPNLSMNPNMNGPGRARSRSPRRS